FSAFCRGADGFASAVRLSARLHLGHLVLRPAIASGAFIRAWQDGQTMRIGMMASQGTGTPYQTGFHRARQESVARSKPAQSSAAIGRFSRLLPCPRISTFVSELQFLERRPQSRAAKRL